MADDAIAIYSVATTINQVIAGGANGKVVDYSPRGILEGDQLQILDATNGAIRGIGTVTRAEAFKCPAGVINTGCYNLMLDAGPAGTQAQDPAYLYAAGNGASIHHNVFHECRCHGILLFAVDVRGTIDGVDLAAGHAGFRDHRAHQHIDAAGVSAVERIA